MVRRRSGVVHRQRGVVHRQLGDEQAVLLDLVSAGYFGRNPAGAAVWELLETPCTLRELVERLSSYVDDLPGTIDGDMWTFLSVLHARALVEVCSADGG